MNRGVRMLAAVAVTALVGAACGVSGGSSAPSGAAAPGARSAGACPPSADLPTPANDHGAAASTGPKVSIEAGDFFFAPTCITGLSSGTVTLAVHNSGQALHNVTITSLGIDEDVAAGQTITVKVTVGGSPLPFVCKYHRSSGMVGALLPS
jgi:plastocyanin